MSKACHTHRLRLGARGAASCALACLLAFGCVPALAACSGGAATEQGETSGPAWQAPAEVALSSYDPGALEGTSDAGIDASHAAQGYVCALGTSATRLKLVVGCDGQSRAFDLPADGAARAYPLTFGSGEYSFRIMENTEADRYVEVFAASADVELASEFEPYVRPNYYCDYDAASPVVARAREAAAGASNEGDVVRAVYRYVSGAITYDTDKAARLADATGYVPNPDATLSEGSGICFDYASLAAAMLRSLGIPCQIVTGMVEPENVYHAWNLVYIDGTWRSVEVSIEANTWSIIDTTFASAGMKDSDEGLEYTPRYVY